MLKMIRQELLLMKQEFRHYWIGMQILFVLFTIYFVQGFTSSRPVEGTYQVMFSACVAALGVLSVLYILQVIRMYVELYGNRAYLLFTLPVPAWQIVVSKLISTILLGFIWSIAMWLVLQGRDLVNNLISFGSLTVPDGVIVNRIEDSFSSFMRDCIPFIFLFPVQLCFSIMIVQKLHLGKARYVIATIIFFFLNWLDGVTRNTLKYNGNLINTSMQELPGTLRQWAMFAVLLVLIIYLATRKMDLE